MDETRQAEIDKQLRRLKAISVGGLKTPDDVKSRMFEYIEYTMGENFASKFRTLNRRFGVPAAKVGTTVGALVQALVAEDLIVCMEREGSEYVFTRKYVDAVTMLFSEYDQYQATIDNLIKYAK